mgnify:CR=1 FL=1
MPYTELAKTGFNIRKLMHKCSFASSQIWREYKHDLYDIEEAQWYEMTYANPILEVLNNKYGKVYEFRKK